MQHYQRIEHIKIMCKPFLFPTDECNSLKSVLHWSLRRVKFINPAPSYTYFFLTRNNKTLFFWNYFSVATDRGASATDRIVHSPQMKAQSYSCQAMISSTSSLIPFSVGIFCNAIFVSERTVPRLIRKWRPRASGVERIHCRLTRKEKLKLLSLLLPYYTREI